MINRFRKGVAVLLACVALTPAHAQDAGIDVEQEYAAVHAACLKYLNGDENAVAALADAGFTVTKRGKRLTALKSGSISVPMNRRPEVSIVIGKSIPMNAQATCQIYVSRIGKPLAEMLNITSTVKIAEIGFTPLPDNGITIAKFARGDELWAIDAVFQEQIGALDQTISRMK
jgi:hypothetical protein